MIIGGGSQAGKLRVHIAKLMGWRKIIVMAGKKKESDLMVAGATDVIDRHNSIADKIKEI